MYLCVLSSIPDPNDVPYDPSPHMNGYKWKHYQVNPKSVERQIRDLLRSCLDPRLALRHAPGGPRMSPLARTWLRREMG